MRSGPATKGTSVLRRLVAAISLVALLLANAAAVLHAAEHESACGVAAACDHEDHPAAEPAHDHDLTSCALCRALAQVSAQAALPVALPVHEHARASTAPAPDGIVPRSHRGFALARGPPSSHA